MRILSAFHYPEWTLKRKLFGYMLLVAALLLMALTAGLSLFGRLNSISTNTYKSMDIQMEIFETSVSSYFDTLAAAGVDLSDEMTQLMETQLAEQGISFAALSSHPEQLEALQQSMLEPLRQTLRREDCSGVYVLLNTTINAAIEDAAVSRAGLYLQVNGYDSTDNSILLYRGPAEAGKQLGIMPHRKWRLEFRTDTFPNYDDLTALSHLPAKKAYRFTDLAVLPGTSDNVMLLAVPMTGKDGTFYGLCGFEVSTSYFMAYHAQPSGLSHLTCLFTPDGAELDTSRGLSCGTSGGYYRVPGGILSMRSIDDGLTCFEGDTIPYVGVTRSIRISPNNENFSLSVMMPKSEYDRSIKADLLQSLILWGALFFFSIVCCYFFSRKFLAPVLTGLEQLKSDDPDQTQFNIPEIDDLFLFLAERDRGHEQTLHVLTQEKEDIQREQERLLSEYKKMQSEVSRLSRSAVPEVPAEEYARFLEGINTLTPTERRIFDYYLSGKSVKEIIAIAAIKESTVRYHNQNIYGKLGVNSLKQLLRCAAMMRRQEESAGMA